MNATLSALIKRQSQHGLFEAAVIPWNCPVLSFGEASNATVATLGLNPSNREFVDRWGNELTDSDRRFHTLGSLGIAQWSDAAPEHMALVGDSCRNYFRKTHMIRGCDGRGRRRARPERPPATRAPAARRSQASRETPPAPVPLPLSRCAIGHAVRRGHREHHGLVL